MRFGVNYTPRVGWFHSWLDLDPALVAEDMATIRSIGADHVRIFPLWPLLQPNRTLIRPTAVDDVMSVVDLAGEAGLTVTVDALQGHLSSFDFLPSWVSTWHERNLFTDPDVVSGEAALVRTLARELSPRPHAEGLSVGNEFIQFAASRHPSPSVMTAADARRWLETMLGAARQEWEDGCLTHSFDDDLWFDDSHPFGPEHAASLGDLTTVHSWVFMQVGPRYGEGHPALALFARYLVELARAWGAPGRKVWLQEVGAPVTHVPASTAPDFLRETIAHLTGLDGQPAAQDLTAVTWWCSHDVSRELADFPELEHSLGLIASDGTVKPVGKAFRDTVREVHEHESRTTASPAALAAVPQAPVLTLPTIDPAHRSVAGPRSELFDQWVRLAADGPAPLLRLP
ncbi:glycoside hydrolase 5 family protein [Actinomyces faecalis]|uniref:glycoside hydrolase 5 family protein n=1 Tax=Actinomyces faecalis TaxID=2722820 RepID=UPI001555EE04|nr:hypothetical protein [Actinomyces faecalis]